MREIITEKGNVRIEREGTGLFLIVTDLETGIEQSVAIEYQETLLVGEAGYSAFEKLEKELCAK